MINKNPKNLNIDLNNFIVINDKQIFVDNWNSTMSFTILQFCEFLKISIPRFCYHDKLSIAGNCRMCMVELKSSFKPVIACATSLMKKMQIYVNSFFVKQARENVMEFLLINHPLDCPICDQGSECDLQDQAVTFGSDRGRFSEIKRSVQDLFMGPVVKTIMTRCIHCTRCVRFSEEIVGNYMLGTLGRGKMTEIGSYYKMPFIDELSGNIVDLCPVGALTSKSYAFKARAWELKTVESIDIFDSLGSNIRIDIKGNEVMRILPKRNDYLNEEWITDKIRFSYEGLKKNRIIYPMLRDSKNDPLNIVSYVYFFSSLANKFNNFKKENVINSFFVEFSNCFTSALDLFILKNVFSYLGINNYICNTNGHFNTDFRSNYLLNSNLNNFSSETIYLLNNVNLKKENPILNSRIKKLKINNGKQVKISYIGPNINLNYDFFHISNNPSTFVNILEGRHFYSIFLNSNNSKRIVNSINCLFNNSFLSNLKYLNNLNLKYSSLLPTSGLVTYFDLGYNKLVNSFNKSNYKDAFVYLYNTECSTKTASFYKEAKIVFYHGTNISENLKKVSNFILPSTSFFEEQLFFSNILGFSQHTNIAVSSIPTQFFSIKELYLNLNNDLFKILSKFKQDNHVLKLFLSSIHCDLLINKHKIFKDIYPYFNINSYYENYIFSISYNSKFYNNFYFQQENVEDYYKTNNLILNSETLQKSALLVNSSKNNFMKNLRMYEYIL